VSKAPSTLHHTTEGENPAGGEALLPRPCKHRSEERKPPKSTNPQSSDQISIDAIPSTTGPLGYHPSNPEAVERIKRWTEWLSNLPQSCKKTHRPPNSPEMCHCPRKDQELDQGGGAKMKKRRAKTRSISHHPHSFRSSHDIVLPKWSSVG